MLELQLERLDACEPLDLTELARISEMSFEELSELVEYGALSPLVANQQELGFSSQCLTPLRTASKLRRDYDLDLFTMAILMGYLHRIESLEGQLQSLQARHF
jgi:chaperone modulatory protein CbpM